MSLQLRSWEEIEAYFNDMNIDPRKLACGCSVKIDLDRVVYPALREIRGPLEAKGIALAAREDADISLKYGEPKIMRRIYRSNEPSVNGLREFNPERAITLTSIYRVHDPEVLKQRWLNLYEQIAAQGVRMTVGKGHTIEAYSKDDEFTLFDFYKTGDGREDPTGYLVVNNDTIQLIDPTLDLRDEAQIATAFSNALNDLFSLGAVENLRLYPVYAAPDPTLREALLENMSAYAERYDMELVEQEPVSERTLLLGVTAFGETGKQTPTFYDHLERGDRILVHRPLGDLAPINLYIDGLIMGPDYLGELGFDPEALREMKDQVIEVMSRPNLEVGRLINRYSPAFDESFDPDRYIKVTGDLSGPGIRIFQEIAELAGVDVDLEEIPIQYERAVQVATEQFIIPNGTSGTNGAVAIIASERVIEQVRRELEALDYDPQVIGTVTAKRAGTGTLSVPEIARRYIADWPEDFRIRDAGGK